MTRKSVSLSCRIIQHLFFSFFFLLAVLSPFFFARAEETWKIVNPETGETDKVCSQHSDCPIEGECSYFKNKHVCYVDKFITYPKIKGKMTPKEKATSIQPKVGAATGHCSCVDGKAKEALKGKPVSIWGADPVDAEGCDYLNKMFQKDGGLCKFYPGLFGKEQDYSIVLRDLAYDADYAYNAEQLNLLGNRDLPTIIGGVIKIFLDIIGAVALAVMVFAGLTWMTSGGNEQRIETAKTTLTWAGLGLVVIFGSYMVISLLFKTLQEPGREGREASGGEQFCAQRAEQNFSICMAKKLESDNETPETKESKCIAERTVALGYCSQQKSLTPTQQINYNKCIEEMNASYTDCVAEAKTVPDNETCTEAKLKIFQKCEAIKGQ